MDAERTFTLETTRPLTDDQRRIIDEHQALRSIMAGPFVAPAGSALDWYVETQVTGLHPKKGPPGTEVSIAGLRLGQTQQVRFGKAIANNISVTPNQVKAKVPDKAETGPITLRVPLAKGGFVITETFEVTDGSGPVERASAKK
jgi:hypothetical protein